MLILGIETSCDETGASIVQNGRKILALITASSEKLQKKFGGVIPESAAREQLKCIIPVIDQAFNKAKIEPEEIDALAVAFGPGLIGSLIVGVESAKTLSFSLKKPLIGVNHVLAHLYANYLNQKKKILFPAIALIASGGHTSLLLMKDKITFKLLGATRDDAAGECFDKTARLLGFPYPGGPQIEKAASQISPSTGLPRRLASLSRSGRAGGLKSQILLPRPMINQNNFDFSFSGLKTAVLTLVKKRKQFNHLAKDQFNKLAAREIQEAIIDVLVVKTLKAVQKYKVRSVLAGGGVAANNRLKKRLYKESYKLGVKLFIPPAHLCTDNAASIAAAAFYQKEPINWRNLKPNPSLFF